ncbi:MAG: hypothetical protein IJC71_07640 [Clostridia bacterium]|nr:hypothetical protein [Clostridia bacterium]
MKKISAFLALLLLLACLSPAAVLAAPDDIPSLFAQDEAWYKDAVFPLIVRDGIRYIPAQLCAMFDSVEVTLPRDGNLLVCNTETGSYISILFMQQTAVMNGEVIRDVPIFRDNEMYYADASLLAEACGLSLETYEHENGALSLRLYDNDRIFTMEELIASYLPQTEAEPEDTLLPELPEESEVPSYDGKLKRIFVLCKSPQGDDVPFPAQKNCELYGIGYTHFLDARSTAEDMIAASADGSYGLYAPDTDNPVGALDLCNDSISVYTRRKSHFTLTTGDDAADAALREAGYIPIVPDFVVNGASRPDSLLVSIINYIGTAGSCTLLLEDCWNSERMAILLSELANSLYRTSNLSEYSVN